MKQKFLRTPDLIGKRKKWKVRPFYLVFFLNVHRIFQQ